MKHLLLVGLLALGLAASATTYYVSPTGGAPGGNNGLSSGSPWALQYALDNIGSSNTVILADGIYTGPFLMSGVSYITVQAQNKWKAVIANSATYGIAANDSAASGGIYQTHHITFDGLCVSNIVEDGIGINNFSTVKNCWIIGTGRQGINSSSHTASNNIIETSLIESNGLSGTGVQLHGMYVSGANNIVRGNVVRHTKGGFGIHFYTGGAGAPSENNNRIYNNLVYGQHGIGAWGVTVWSANGDDGTSPGTNYVYGNTIMNGLSMAYGGLWITNNIILPGLTDPAPMVVQGGRTVYGRGDYNLGTNAMLFAGSHDVVTNYAGVGLVSPANGRFWLTSGSAARGSALSTICGTNDFFGTTQSSVTDIGFNQYSYPYSVDARNLAVTTGAPYWDILTGSPLTMSASIASVTTLRVINVGDQQGPAPIVPLFVAEDFETGTQPATFETDATVTWGFSPALLGSYSMALSNTASASCYHSADGYETNVLYTYFMMRTSNMPSSEITVIQQRATNDAVQLKINLTAGGVIKLLDFGDNSVSTVGTISANTTYHFWTRYTAGTGANAILSVAFNTTASEPTSGNNFATMSNGTSNHGVAYVQWLGGNANAWTIFDHIGLDKTDTMLNGWP